MDAEITPSRIHLLSGLIFLVVFLAGAATGAGTYAWLRPPGPPMPRHHRPGGLPPPWDELGLTTEQQEKARPIFEQYRAAVESAVQSTLPQVRAAQQQLEKDLRPILTEAQATRLAQIQQRRPPHLGPPGPPGPPGALGPPGQPPGPPDLGPPPPGEPPPPPRP